MACRIKNLKPPCGYWLEGVEAAFLLDYDDFGGYRFLDDKLSDTALVTAIIRKAALVEVLTPDGAKYASTLNNKIYTHTFDTFVPDLPAEIMADLNLGIRRRFLVIFKLNNGRYFTFGYDAGAVLTYTNQTAGAIGSAVSLVASSVYPLFEVRENALDIDSAEWILTDARYGMGEFWFDTGKWNY